MQKLGLLILLLLFFGVLYSVGGVPDTELNQPPTLDSKPTSRQTSFAYCNSYQIVITYYNPTYNRSWVTTNWVNRASDGVIEIIY